ncbi:MAG TPA: hypothetical protein VK081_00520, partial [Planctomycetota bacterium]|nr:hypothetical protein [Planctomycetota bacterium]
MHSNLLPPFLPALALFSLAPAQAPDVVRAERAPVVLGPSPAVASHDTNANRWADGLAGLADQVLFDAPGDGRIWALAATYKASFGAEGFTYVPFFGSQAPRNYPVRFVVRGVRVGGVALQLAKDAKVVRDGARVSLLRGPVREVYDLAPRSVEQTFVVDGDLPGDVEVEVEVVTDLVEDRARDGLQFGNELGFVEYGSACLVRGTERTAIASVFVDGVLRLVVPAAQRGPGAVIIDPIITTSSLTRTTVASELPDVAYDATTDRWAVVWANVFSQTDHDIVAELRTGRGESIAGSYRSIDATTTSHSWPRIANLNAADRFLITMERHDSQGSGAQYSVWSRTLEAASPFPVGPMVQISPNASVDQKSADVGGDPGTGTNWAVVWLHGTDVHARLVDASGTPSSPVIPIERTSAVCINPQISLSNGNGQVAQPHWCIVYMNQASGSNWDVYGATLAPDGTVTRPHGPIAVAASNDLYTYVSSPLVDGRTKPVFLVSYERQEASGPEMIAVGIDSD